MSARESPHSDQADRGADNQIKQTAFHLWPLGTGTVAHYLSQMAPTV